MTTNEVTPYKPRDSRPVGGWFALLVILAVIGAVALIPALAHIVIGIIGAVIGIIAGLISVLVALVATAVGIGAAAVGLVIVFAVPLLIVAALVGIGILIGRSGNNSNS